jgi:hypothetical protein
MDIAGLSRARLKRMIAAGNVPAFTIGLWAFFFPTLRYTLGFSLWVLPPLCALALERTRGMLGFEARRGASRSTLAPTIVLAPALALCLRWTKRQLRLVSGEGRPRRFPRRRKLASCPARFVLTKTCRPLARLLDVNR